MSSKRTEAASATEWESHKITMQKLFVGDNKSLDEVMWHMKTEYSFVASYALLSICYIYTLLTYVTIEKLSMRRSLKAGVLGKTFPQMNGHMC